MDNYTCPCGQAFKPCRKDARYCSNMCARKYRPVGSATKRCSKDQCDELVRARGLCVRHYALTTTKPTLSECAICSKPVLRYGKGRHVCSPKCYGELKRLDAGSPSRELVGPVMKLTPPAYRTMKPTGHARRSKSVRFVFVCCGWCDFGFIHDLRITGTIAQYCTQRCARKSQRARYEVRVGRFAISQKSRLAIYNRDSWVCQICEHPVDASLPPTSDWAASLDHVEPQSVALIPNHHATNLRLAHRMCNSIRGVRD